ncbi:MAG: glycerophosphodiester phosphodiesterase [bacterium]
MNRIAHRGIHEQYPENSSEAVQTAFDSRADGVEVDVRILYDHTLVLHHDATLGNPSNSSNRFRPLTAMTESELRRNASFNVMTVPRCIETKPANKSLTLECKPGPNIHTFDRELLQALPKHLPDNLIVSSSDFELLEDLDHRSTLNLAPVIRSVDGLSRSYLHKQDWHEIHIRHTLCNEDTLDEIRPFHDGSIIAWTVNQEERINELEELNVDGIMTDNVRLIQ